jgi:hypothetical protein
LARNGYYGGLDVQAWDHIDIEDRKRAEEELRRKENFLKTAQRLSQSGSFS